YGTVDEEQDKEDINKKLKQAIRQRDQQVRHTQLVGEVLVQVRPAGDEEVLLPVNAVDDGDDDIHTIYQEYQHPGKIACASNQLKEYERQHEGHRHAAHIAGDTSGEVAEVEVQEHHHSHDHRDDETCVAEVDDVVVDIIVRHQRDHGVNAGHAVDAVHKIKGVQCADANHKHDHHQPQGMCVHPCVPHNHGEGRCLRGKAYEGMLAFQVVYEAHHRQDRHTDYQPGEREPVHGKPAVNGQHEHHASTSDGRGQVRAPCTWLVDDLVVLGDTEIHKHPSEE